MRKLPRGLLCCARVRCDFSRARPRDKSPGQMRFACKTGQKLAGSRMAQAMASCQGLGICPAGMQVATRGAWPAMVRVRLTLMAAPAQLSGAACARRNEASGDASGGCERQRALERDCCEAVACACAGASSQRQADPAQEVPCAQACATRRCRMRISPPGQERMRSTTGPSRRPWRRRRGRYRRGLVANRDWAIKGFGGDHRAVVAADTIASQLLVKDASNSTSSRCHGGCGAGARAPIPGAHKKAPVPPH
jgi:hypothetical protein